MVNEHRELKEMIQDLEQQYGIEIIRVYHEQNQIQLIGANGFGKLQIEDVSVIRRYTAKHDCWTGRFEGTEFIYLV